MFDDTHIEMRLLELISATNGIPREKIKLETQLEELNLDSLVLVELSLKLHKEFGIERIIDQLDLLETVEDLFQLVKKYQTA